MYTNLRQSGFTLIEMIVSLAVFSMVVTVAVGALLVLVSTNERLQGEQSVMTNLSFALDSMTREIRTGTRYYCDVRQTYTVGGSTNIFNGGNNLDDILFDAGNNEFRTNDCLNGNPNNWRLQGVAFVEGGDSVTGNTNRRILYFFDNQTSSDPKRIYRRLGTRVPEPITSSDIEIRKLEFFVSGSGPQSDGDNNQPIVTIVIEAVEAAKRNDPTAKVYSLQTTITQRTFDI